MAGVEYGNSLKGDVLRFVHEVCELELGVSMGREKIIQWSAHPEIFAGYLALNPVALKFPPNNRGNNFLVNAFELILDNGDMSLFIDREEEGDLNGDVWVEDVLDQSRAIFDSHDHERCLVTFAPRQEGIVLPALRSIHGEVLQH